MQTALTASVPPFFFSAVSTLFVTHSTVGLTSKGGWGRAPLDRFVGALFGKLKASNKIIHKDVFEGNMP